MDRPNGSSEGAWVLPVVSVVMCCFGIGFALYSLSEWMATGRLYTGSRGTRAWRTYEGDPSGFVLSAVFCVAFVVMPVWYLISKRRQLFGDDD